MFGGKLALWPLQSERAMAERGSYGFIPDPYLYDGAHNYEYNQASHYMNVPFTTYGGPEQSRHSFMYSQQGQPDVPQRATNLPATSTSTNVAKLNSNNSSNKKTTKTKYDTWTQEQQKLLVQLWANHHENLESKESRITWGKICDELNRGRFSNIKYRPNTDGWISMC